MLQRAHQAIKPKWGREILDILSSEPLRYTDLLVRLGVVAADQPVHSRTFQATLVALTGQGLIEHRTKRVPPDYTLTNSGQRLVVALRHIEAWDQDHLAEQPGKSDSWRT
ncbi:winged helix-turn-helix transcriptional regulator [Paractinoplanes rishiriensis]|uniref:HTH hxlR-type domain-containing protein n=1 Tax=Paractinoplanes rishiriensis TaxID=1050105 RepID=A0A919JS83_9ACTN|nr:winged helix-turn-helix transcriptional regulator [Actinoplanes rishiriensis]GIE93885.1 hypothetical protein Ari01nite_13500 [Actinoplanes rishiriensis]